MRICIQDKEITALVSLVAAVMSGPGPQVVFLGIQSLLAMDPPMMLAQVAVGW
jgi:hypothetical protein